jgi:LmbE family N-acetylglucosaminyl deacetylase
VTHPVRTVLHVAPHPDDECIGAPCTLLGLADRGARVIVVACGLGRPADQERRRRELVAATSLAGLDLVVREPPAALSSSDDLDAARAALTPWLTGLLDEHDADLVIGPQLHDVHPAHEAVALAVQAAIPASRRPPVWWQWGIWADLPVPTLLVPCPDELVERGLAWLRCYPGELSRNDYADMVRAAHRLNAIRGVERLGGFGSARLGTADAELLTELGWDGRGWRLGVPRVAEAPELPADWGDDATPLLSLGRPSRPPR